MDSNLFYDRRSFYSLPTRRLFAAWQIVTDTSVPQSLTGILEADRRMTVNVDYRPSVDERRIAAANSGLLGTIAALAREKKTWSPGLLPGVLWRAVSNIATFYGVLQLIKLHPFSEAARLHPRFAFKYLTHDYLARSFTVPERAACFIHHYTRLRAEFPDRLLRQCLRADITLHEVECGASRFAFSMGLPRIWDKEGELSLNLHLDGVVVFVLSFTIVPGWIVQSQAADVLLISRIQGVYGCFNEIRRLTRALHDVGPAALLLAAFYGFAAALGIGEFAAVSATRQSSYTEELSALYIDAYDNFFIGLGLVMNDSGFFLSPIPHQDKPLSSIKQGHKLRTREKRAFKHRIAQAVCLALQHEIAAAAVPLIAAFPDRVPDAIES
jgi:uncharacterized protein VirK/YbjX